MLFDFFNPRARSQVRPSDEEYTSKLSFPQIIQILVRKHTAVTSSVYGGDDAALAHGRVLKCFETKITHSSSVAVALRASNVSCAK